jgi:hypothetical protein
MWMRARVFQKRWSHRQLKQRNVSTLLDKAGIREAGFEWHGDIPVDMAAEASTP